VFWLLVVGLMLVAGLTNAEIEQLRTGLAGQKPTKTNPNQSYACVPRARMGYACTNTSHQFVYGFQLIHTFLSLSGWFQSHIRYIDVAYERQCI